MSDKLPLIGRDRVLMTKLTESLTTDRGQLGKIRETSRGCKFEIKMPEGHIALVTVELDRLEQGGI